MREKRNFAERTQVLQSNEAKKKYFLIYEGSSTEILYFDAINSNRNIIGISPLIELIPIIRSYSEEGWSNPQKILDRVIKNIEENKLDCISYETLLNRIMDYFHETNIATRSRVVSKNIWYIMTKICEERLQKTLESDVEDIKIACNTILELLNEECDIINIVEDISHIIKCNNITYAKGFDKICLIVDRDKDSFTLKQYNDVFNKCEEKGFKFCVTNPCFEFWLLLHFDNVFKLDKNKLLENPKVTAKRRYTEQELRKVFKGYKKNNYKAEELVKNIDKAIHNEARFCEDIKELKNKVGSNIGILISEMLQ